MLRTATTLALYCPHCGKLDLYDVSVFTLPRGGLTFRCTCGHVKATLMTRQDRRYVLRIPCHQCGIKHDFVFSYRRFWRGPVDKIYCCNKKLELGFIGDKEAVYGIWESCRRALAGGVDGEGELVNAEIMYCVLNKVHDIAEQGGLYCRCGSRDIAVDLLADRLRLTCCRCGGVMELDAGTDGDLAAVCSLAYIEVGGNCRTRHKG